MFVTYDTECPKSFSALTMSTVCGVVQIPDNSPKRAVTWWTISITFEVESYYMTDYYIVIFAPVRTNDQE